MPISAPKSLVFKIIIAIPLLAVGTVFGLLLTTHSIKHMPSGSMLPTIESGEYIIVSDFAYYAAAPARGDVIIFNRINEQGQASDFAKRLIGIPGDRIEMGTDKSVRINGERVRQQQIGMVKLPADAYLSHGDSSRMAVEVLETLDSRSYHIVHTNKPDHLRMFSAITLGEDEYFVLGDHRDNSYDSRHYGPIHRSQIRGKALFLGNHD